MKIKSRNETLNDVLKEAKRQPKNWKAIFGKDIHALSSDYYLYHPNVGLYFLKEYQKNVYERKGVGGKIARQVDSDIEKNINNLSDNFGIIQGDLNKIAYNLKQGVHPQKIINGALEGNDLGLQIPIRGKSSDSKETYHNLKENVPSSKKKIDHAFEKLAKKEGLYQSYD